MKSLLSNVLRNSHLKLITLLSIAILAPVCIAQADEYERWENGITEPWWFDEKTIAKENVAAARVLWESINKENKNDSIKEWVGDYFVGSDVHGSYLRWSQQNGFVLVDVDRCQAKLMSLAYGKVVTTPSLIQFFPEYEKQSQGSHAHRHTMPTKYVPVKWHGAHYLIPESAMSNFGDHVAGLGEFNEWAGQYIELSPFFFKLNDGENNATGDDPVVPLGYERFLKKPLEATITAVGKRIVKRNYTYGSSSYSETHTFASLTFVSVNVGAMHGVKRGIVFRVLDSVGGERVRIVRSGKFSSTGIVVRDLDEDGGETFYNGELERTEFYPKVTAGWKLTTIPF